MVPEEKIVQRYEEPSVAQMKLAALWLVAEGARAGSADMAVREACVIGKDTDTVWVSTLHKVVNRCVRENRPGWSKYEGNWVDFTRMFETIEP